jgi:Ca2+-binding EF-hand superfamily protein
MNRMRSIGTVFGLVGMTGLLGLLGCQSTEEYELANMPENASLAGEETKEEIAAEPVLPMDVAGTVDTRWDYLLGKYDADGDGRIAAEEYDRGELAFTRLDQSGDGHLTEVDFASGPSREAMMGEMRAQRMLGRYFQDGVDPTLLTRVELEATFSVYDVDGNEILIQEEFAAHQAAAQVGLAQDDSRMVQRMMGDVDPWDALLAIGDTDGDECLAVEEMMALFDRFDDDGVGKLDWSASPAREQGSSGASRPDGPAAGTVAPDFTLEPPEGGKAVTLSSFKGAKPVALIFGSYT